MRSFVTAIVVLILGIACLGIAAFRGMATRFPIAGIVPLAWSVIDFFFAFTQSSIDSQAEKVTDERDRYIAMKSSRKVLLIANYVIGAGEFQRQQMVFRVVGGLAPHPRIRSERTNPCLACCADPLESARAACDWNATHHHEVS